MASETPAHASSTEYEDIYDSTSASQSPFAIILEKAHTSATTSTSVTPRNTALGALPALSNQSQLDSHSTVATSTFCPNEWYLLLTNPLLFGHLQDWEHLVSFFDEGIDSGTLMMQNNSNQEPPLLYNDQVTIPVCFSAQPLTEMSREGGPISAVVAPELDASHYSPFGDPFWATHSPDTSRAVIYQPHLPLDTSVPEERSYDRPGKKPAAPSQPDPLKLEEFCQQVGGRTFAVDWIVPTFRYGVSTEALHRVLERKEIDEMNFPGGFEPHQAYDGFISKVGERYECGLCKEGNRTRWKHKKDAPRHLRKFHFGLADVCKDCGKDVFSRAEMKTHRCVRRAEGHRAESSGAR